MNISGAEASDLLRKWCKDRIRVRAFLTSGANAMQLAVKVTGFVRGFPNERSWSIMVLDSPFNPAAPLEMPDNPDNLILIADPTAIANFEYIEAKDEDKPEEIRQYFSQVHGIACLTVNLSEGERLSIFEVEA